MQIEVICLARADPKSQAASSSPWVLFPYKPEHLLWPAGSVTDGGHSWGRSRGTLRG